ncbi:hypothetical protein QBC46DRAFT_394872, partial [Diplogelasinospora grovesii]
MQQWASIRKVSTVHMPSTLTIIILSPLVVNVSLSHLMRLGMVGASGPQVSGTAAVTDGAHDIHSCVSRILNSFRSWRIIGSCDRLRSRCALEGTDSCHAPATEHHTFNCISGDCVEWPESRISYGGGWGGSGSPSRLGRRCAC